MPKRSKAPLIAAGVVILALVGWRLMPTPAVTVVDCGDVSARPEGGGPAWTHDSWCTLKGVVHSERVIMMGKGDRGANGARSQVGVRWFVKLDGAAAVAMLAGDDPAIYAYYERHGESLRGFTVEGTGRLFDADQEKGYGGLGLALRKQLGIAPETQLWMFDAAAQPPE
jgi:hypothetical protein